MNFKLKKVYNVKVVKYNWNEEFASYNKKFENYPTENDLSNFLIEINQKNTMFEYFTTTIQIEECYDVIMEKPLKK